MRAALLEGVGDVKVVDDVEIEKPHEGEVLVRVQHCGVCHSDLHFVDGSLPCPFPAILGHEAGGIVEAVGAGVTGLAEGDKVILSLRPPCGRCYFCVRGQFSICPQYADMMGVLPDGGTRLAHQGRTVSRAGVFLAAFAEQAVVPANGVVTLLGGLVIAGLGWRMVDAGNRPRRAVLAASIATAVATVWALIDASSADDSFRADVSLDRAYGQWVLLAGAVLAVLVSLALVARARGGDDAGGEGRPG